MSAVRKAIIAVLSGPSMDEFVLGNEGTDDLIDQLVTAVERVPVQVTIRELDMADPANIVTVADRSNINYVYGLVMTAAMEHDPLHLTVDGSYLKLKVGNGSWSAPIETEVYEG